jgi:hypothetical protein
LLIPLHAAALVSHYLQYCKHFFIELCWLARRLRKKRWYLLQIGAYESNAIYLQGVNRRIKQQSAVPHHVNVGHFSLFLTDTAPGSFSLYVPGGSSLFAVKGFGRCVVTLATLARTHVQLPSLRRQIQSRFSLLSFLNSRYASFVFSVRAAPRGWLTMTTTLTG